MGGRKARERAREGEKREGGREGEKGGRRAREMEREREKGSRSALGLHARPSIRIPRLMQHAGDH